LDFDFLYFKQLLLALFTDDLDSTLLNKDYNMD